ncbi:hypothetical protein AYJ57_20870 (plasmid) [Salipiger sp. CCB-MM3]|nr:hypothetical protein AYJ57_20870 [Salipiger sp. CCB-MM3]
MSCLGEDLDGQGTCFVQTRYKDTLAQLMLIGNAETGGVLPYEKFEGIAESIYSFVEFLDEKG